MTRADRPPPRAARWLVRRILPAGLREEVDGDLRELFARTAERAGLRAARRAYWREALSPSLLGLRRAAGAHVSQPSFPGGGLVAGLLADLRHAFRLLRRAPGFAAIAVLSIALGIGPNTAILSLVNGVLFADPGFPEPERTMGVYSDDFDGSGSAVGLRTWERVVEGTQSVFGGQVAGFTQFAGQLGEGGERLVLGELVTGNYFDVLRPSMALGRGFLPEEYASPGAAWVVVLSHHVWQQDFGGDAGIVGREVRLSGRPYTVVGVAGRAFPGRTIPGVATDVWAPVTTYPHLNPGQPTSGNLFLTARLLPGVPVERAAAAVRELGERLEAERRAAGSSARYGLLPAPATETLVFPGLDGPILAMAGVLVTAVALILLVACTNLAGYLLARATDRRREMAIRGALGASRTALARQLLVETMVLTLLGGAAGVGLGVAVLKAIAAIRPPIPIPVRLDMGLDWTVLLASFLLTVAAGVLVGLVPALRAGSVPLERTLRAEGGAVVGGSAQRVRGLLVATQVAFSMLLLLGAGLFLRSFLASTSFDPGFDTGPGAVVQVDARSSGWDGEATARLAVELPRRAAEIPGVGAVGATARMPLQLGNIVTWFDIPGAPPPTGQDHHRLELAGISPGYFEVMGIDILAGRGLSEVDGPDAPRVVVVSRAAAERFWPGQDPVGRLLVPTSSPEEPWRVVGVAEDVKIWSLTEAPRPYLYAPLAQEPSPTVQLVLRGNAPPEQLAAGARAWLAEAYPGLFVAGAGSMADHLGFILYLPRMGALILAALGGLALLLATLGIYGMVSYAVARREREVGIRMALGAGAASVVRMAMRGALVLVAVGALVGAAAAALGAGALEGLLVGVAGLDAVTFLAVPLVLLAVAAAAAFVPARRAARVDPMRALRAD